MFFLWILLAAFCLWYGLMMKGAATGTGFYKVWLGLSGINFLLFILSVFGVFWKLPSIVKIVILVAVMAGIIVFIVTEGLILSHFHDCGVNGLDFIIILGAQVKGHDPSKVLTYRLNTSARYLKDNPKTLCIVSGGKGEDEILPEAHVMASCLTKMGIDIERIIQEDTSTSTRENIRNSMRLIPSGASIGIVTNNFHLFRALLTAKQLGLTGACGIAAESTPFFLLNNLLREFLAVIKYCIQRAEA